MRLQKHCALHHFLISDSQSIKSCNPKKWISVLNFCILKTLFPRLLRDKMDATFGDSSRHLPSRNCFETNNRPIIFSYKDILYCCLVNCEILKEVSVLFTCVFVSSHSIESYVTIHACNLLFNCIFSGKFNRSTKIYLPLERGAICPSKNRKLLIYPWILNTFGCNKLGMLTTERMVG